MRDPIVELYPSAYKASTVYAQKPADNTEGIFTFARAGSAWRRNKDGQITEQTTNVPRLDYLKPKYISYKNFLNHTEIFTADNTDWFNFVNGGTLVLTDQYPDPKGTTKAWNVETSNTNQGLLTQNLTVANATDYTLSVWARGLTGSEKMVMALRDNTSNGDGGVSYPADYTTLTTEWKRYSWTITSTGTARGCQMRFADCQRGVGAIQIAFPQCEESSTLTDYERRIDLQNDYHRLEPSDCPALILEPGQTNSMQRGTEINGTYYNATNVTLTAQAYKDPAGGNNATKVTTTTAASAHSVNRNVASITGGAHYTFSVFVKNIDSPRIWLRMYPNTVINDCQIFYNLDECTVEHIQNGTIIAYGIDDYGNGWKRPWMTILTDATDTSVGCYVGPMEDAGSVGYAGTGKSILVYGFDVKNGLLQTTHIPTTSSTVSRPIEVGTDLGQSSAIFNSLEGTVFVDLHFLTIGSAQAISISDDTLTNRIKIQGVGSDNTQYSVQMYVGGAAQATIDISGAQKNKRITVAFKWESSGIKVYQDGTLVGSDTSVTNFSANTLTHLHLADGDGVSNDFFGRIYALRVWDEALTDEELIELTA